MMVSSKLLDYLNFIRRSNMATIGTMRFSSGSIINGVRVDELSNAEKEAFIASQENKGRKVIIEGWNDNDE